MAWITRFVDEFGKHLLSDTFAVLVFTVAARAGWGLAHAAYRFARFYLSPAIALFPVDLTRLAHFADGLEGEFGSISVYCQLVRFGADDYLKNLASEQEKYEGRLQNRVLPVPMTLGEHGYAGQLLLPVHRRLGTQFKMFLMTDSSTRAKMLVEMDYFKDSDRHAKRRGRRISFTLKDVDTIANTEKTTFNNIVYPSNLHDFVEWNSFGAGYLRLQRWRWWWAQQRARRA